MSKNAWEKQAGESSKAYEAFVAYRDLGAGRTLVDVAQRAGKAYSLIRRWHKNWDWEIRASAWDNRISERAAMKAAEEYSRMIETQLNIGKMLQARATKALQRLDLEKVSERSLPAILKMLESGIRIERSARELETLSSKPKMLTINIVTQDSPIGGEG